jgi:phosphoribosyl-ATP pyrophosphohydrolase
MQERAANIGYDWPSIDGVIEKVTEEANEIVAATTRPSAKRSSATC